MKDAFDELTRLMSDPFQSAVFRGDPSGWSKAAGLTPDEVKVVLEPDADAASAMAGGPWQPSETCWDPGPDPFPDELEA